MIAYHFTSVVHLPWITSAGKLTRTESNLSIEVRGAGPDVVWLLDSPDMAGANHGLAGSSVDKTEVCFEVDAPDRWTTRWAAWADAQGMDPEWRKSFVDYAGGKEAAARWLICFAELPEKTWRRVWNTKTGHTYFERGEDRW